MVRTERGENRDGQGYKAIEIEEEYNGHSNFNKQDMAERQTFLYVPTSA